MKQKDILFILAFTAFSAMGWVGFSIHHNFATSTISKDLNANIIPISPDFDLQIIDSLKKREHTTALFEFKTQVPQEASPSGKTQEEGKNPL